MQVEPLTTLNPSRVPGATPLPSRTASFGPWPETAPLRMVFPSCHLQNDRCQAEPDAKQVKGLGLPFRQQTN